MKKTIEVLFPGGMEIDAKTDGMEIKTDQRERNGGKRAYPEPFEYFLASIATCSGSYAADYCLQHDLAIDGLGMRLHAEWNREKRMMSHFELELAFSSAFTEDHKKAIVKEIEDCTVKRHLREDIQFVVRVIDKSE